MSPLPPFSLLRPDSLDEAIKAAAQHKDARFLAGGTDLMVNMRRGLVKPACLIDLSEIAELRQITFGEKQTRIGGLVSLARLIREPELDIRYPIIAEAAAQIAAPAHREMASLAGNLCLDTRCVFYNQSEWWRGAIGYCLKYDGDICHVAKSGKTCFAAFHGDLAPVLLVLGARVEIAGPEGRRVMALHELYSGDGKTPLTLKKGEILTAVILENRPGTIARYEKARIRSAIDFPLAGVAIARAKPHKNKARLQIALTGIDVKPVQLEGAELTITLPLSDEAESMICKLVTKAIQPMQSSFSPPGYRRKLAVNLTRRLLREMARE